MRTLPASFKQIFWSYNLSSLDLERNSREIIVNTINYGNLNHWRWIVKKYGAEMVWRVIKQTKPGEIREGAARLARIIFG